MFQQLLLTNVKGATGSLNVNIILCNYAFL